MLHADGQLFAADRAEPVPGLGLNGGEADAAVAVAVQMVFALLRKKFHSAIEPLPGADGPDKLRIGEAGVQQVRLPAQLAGGVGVGVGDQGEAVQGGEPPVHGRVGGEAGLHGVDMAGETAEAAGHGVKAGKGAEESEVGRPDVGGDQLRVRAGLQDQLQQVPAVQAQDGPPVGVDVADGLQPDRRLVRRLQAGEQDQVVDFAGLAVPLIDAADLPGDQEAGGLPRPRYPQVLPQDVQALFGGKELLAHLLPPGGVGKVAGAADGNALSSGPPVQMGQVAVPAGGTGKAGVDMEISNVHGYQLLCSNTRWRYYIAFFCREQYSHICSHGCSS